MPLIGEIDGQLSLKKNCIALGQLELATKLTGNKEQVNFQLIFVSVHRNNAAANKTHLKMDSLLLLLLLLQQTLMAFWTKYPQQMKI